MEITYDRFTPKGYCKTSRYSYYLGRPYIVYNVNLSLLERNNVKTSATRYLHNAMKLTIVVHYLLTTHSPQNNRISRGQC